MGHVHADLAAVDAMLDLIGDLTREVGRHRATLQRIANGDDDREQIVSLAAASLCAEPCAEVPAS